MSDYSPIGIHKQNARSTSEEFNLKVTKAANMVSSTALEAAGLANAWADKKMPFPVFRSYTFEPGHNKDYMTAESAYAFCRNLVRSGQVKREVYFNVNCEHSMTDLVYDIYMGMIDLSMSDPDGVIGFVFSNAAHLTSSWDYAGNHYARPKAKAYLEKMYSVKHVKNAAGYPAFIHGDHWYTSGHWNAFVNEGQFAGNPKSAFDKRWDTGEWFVDWSKPQWHYNKPQMMKDALGWKFDPAIRKWVAKDPNNPPTHDIPWIGLTEVLKGGMSIPAFLAANPDWIDTPPYNQDKWGYKTFTNWWRLHYPERFGIEYKNHPLYPNQVIEHGAGGIVVDMMRMMWRHVCLSLGTVLFMHHYADGDTSGDDNRWLADNTRDDPGFYIAITSPPFERIPYFDGTTTPPPPDPAPNPGVDDPRWLPYLAVVPERTNVRPTSSRDNPPVAKIEPPNVLLAHIPFDALNAAERVLARPEGNFEWYAVKLEGGAVGWIRDDVVELFAVEPEPEPPLLVRTVYEQWLAEMKSSLQDSAYVLAEVEASRVLIETQVERLDTLEVWETARRDRTAASVKLIETILSNMED